jgi:hypothetical protein
MSGQVLQHRRTGYRKAPERAGGIGWIDVLMVKKSRLKGGCRQDCLPHNYRFAKWAIFGGERLH